MLEVRLHKRGSSHAICNHSLPTTNMDNNNRVDLANATSGVVAAAAALAMMMCAVALLLCCTLLACALAVHSNNIGGAPCALSFLFMQAPLYAEICRRGPHARMHIARGSMREALQAQSLDTTLVNYFERMWLEALSS